MRPLRRGYLTRAFSIRPTLRWHVEFRPSPPRAHVTHPALLGPRHAANRWKGATTPDCGGPHQKRWPTVLLRRACSPLTDPTVLSDSRVEDLPLRLVMYRILLKLQACSSKRLGRVQQLSISALLSRGYPSAFATTRRQRAPTYEPFTFSVSPKGRSQRCAARAQACSRATSIKQSRTRSTGSAQYSIPAPTGMDTQQTGEVRQ